MQADSINRFNEWVSQLQTSVAAANAQSRQAASDRNVSESQRISDTNKQTKQATETSNLDRYNQLLGQKYNDELTKRMAAAGAGQKYGDILNQLTNRDQANYEKMFRSVGKIGGYASGLGM